jgi:hypothetical protein
MLLELAVGRVGVQQAHEASRSALPNAPMVPEPERRPSAVRIRAAGVLHRLADRIGPVDARAVSGPLRQT